MTLSNFQPALNAQDRVPATPIARWTLFAAWLCAAAIALFQIALPTEKQIVEFGIGDALVYARVAFNVARGLGSTYSLETPTNGYHPLWMLLQVPLFWGATDIASRLWLAKALWALTALANAVAWSLFVRRLTQNYYAAAMAALLFAGFGWSLFVLYSGIETPLALLLLCATFAAATRLRAHVGPTSTKLLIIYALAGTLTFLARLDSIFILMGTLVIILPALWRMRLHQSLALLPGLLVIPYFAWNQLIMKMSMPVSGYVKTSVHPGFGNAAELLSAWTARMARIGIEGPILGVAMVVAILPAGWCIWMIVRRGQQLGAVLLCVLAGAIIQYTYYLFCMTEINVPWHMYPQFLFGYLMLCSVIAWAESIHRRFAGAVFAALVLVFGGTTYLYAQAKQVRQVETETALEIGHWIKENLPAESGVLMQDSFTVGALVPDMRLYDMSGLVEDREGASKVKGAGGMSLLSIRPITHVVIHTRDMTTPAEIVINDNKMISNEMVQSQLLKSFEYQRGSQGRFLIYAVNRLKPAENQAVTDRP